MFNDGKRKRKRLETEVRKNLRILRSSVKCYSRLCKIDCYVSHKIFKKQPTKKEPKERLNTPVPSVGGLHYSTKFPRRIIPQYQLVGGLYHSTNDTPFS